ncbi:DEKNAAC100037 [Brettanomyces naardenensis]|uniref:DEKNAAC100037 n=1 Tax=Brettanomyces naardenensis TaxID=13370 RepID=A0A448YEP5_BRENA|nr:DEKNAAC100037 [Brettanomyces naardenensis]
MIAYRSSSGLVGQSVKVVGGQVNQVRYRRTLAYPFYSKAGNIPPARHGRKQTVFKRLMDEFLGPKNYKGEYYLNKYTYPNQNHSTNYIDPSSERGDSLLKASKKEETGTASSEQGVDFSKGSEALNGRRRKPLQPFPMNSHSFTNVQLGRETKEQIVNDVMNLKLSSQNVALKYGLKIQRIEAVVKLHEVEENWKKSGMITKDLQTMSNVMYKMFPVYDASKNPENLTEIPIPEQTKQSRFITIAESEPFGPVDAAKEFGLEPAAVTLQKLSEGGEHSSHSAISKGEAGTSNDKTFIAKMHEGDRSAFRFTDVKVGQVGYRYGRPFRDNRKDRKIGFDAAGKMVYLFE